ncbi:MAG: hypothetical protein IM600_10730 [Bacteroidetes bacterium]|nr:hypothetical protein [Bacteroidota bacterium]MCA6443893.1 hypothetical protein [Bacteroidota bacterium]
MKKMKLALVVAITAIMCSCSITQPMYLTNNPIGNKVGKSTTVCLFSGGGRNAAQFAPMAYGYSTGYYGLITNQNFSIYEAAKQANISKIATVDMRTDWYLFFTKKTYIVTGE